MVAFIVAVRNNTDKVNEISSELNIYILKYISTDKPRMVFKKILF